MAWMYGTEPPPRSALSPAPGGPWEPERPARRPRQLLSRGPRALGPQEQSFVFKMEVDVTGESRTTLSTLSVPLAEVSSAARTEAEKPRCSSTPCSPLRRTVAGYQILHMDSNYLVGFTTGKELLKLAHKYIGSEENKGESGPNLGSRHLDSGLPRSSRLYKTRSKYFQPYEIPAVNGRRRRRMPSSGDKYNKALPYEPYKSLHGPLPLCLLKGKRAHSKSLDYLNLDKMSIKEPADTEVLQYQLQHLTLRGDRMFSRNST
ncbi:macrophage immunometabolism regulator isoform X2 [Melospiza georgiana]|uniref:macrophage immunometabolism regulator isoform X2 n=2 Tax=Melospiza georgiana TaxID=44398 RepID=UPI0025AC5089|nr:macrophage immunometabolism regulator isoform X2 [Melospiza georgiana]